MKLNRTAKVFIITTLAGVSCAGFITTTAVSAQAQEGQGRPHRHAVAQRVERTPEPPKRVERTPEPPAPEPPAPEPMPPARLTINIG